jgi:hypothetical protein
MASVAALAFLERPSERTGTIGSCDDRPRDPRPDRRAAADERFPDCVFRDVGVVRVPPCDGGDGAGFSANHRNRLRNPSA